MAATWTDAQVLAQLNSGRKWSGATITYAFPSLATSISGTEEQATFKPITSAQQALFTLAILSYDDLIAPNFQFTSAVTSNVEFAYTSTGIEYAHAYYPTTGSAWFKTGSDVATAAVGNYGYATIVHELGHAMGLNHMGDYNGSGTWTPSSYQDSTVLSIMSYFGPSGSTRSTEVMWADWTAASGVSYNAQTPMLNDVMALQAIYGASTTTRTGDTVYGFGSNITGAMASLFDFTINLNPILTIFDSGGTDTLNLSGWSTRSVIKLEAGGFTSANSMTNNIAIAYGAVIENAVAGSGGDAITGNSAANRLDGGAGNDTIAGGAGDDFLIGGTGNDSLDGGSGFDTAVFSGAFASYTFTLNGVTGAITVVNAITGTDTVVNMESFQFSDLTKPSSALFTNDVTAPTLTSATPADNATLVATSSSLVLVFSEAVVAGSGNISIYSSAGQVVQSIAAGDTTQVAIAGNTVTINPAADLSAGTSYYINMAAGSFKDSSGNSYAGLTGGTAYNFSTIAVADTTAPTLSLLSPADNLTTVAVGANLVFTFSEAIKLGTGNITIYSSAGVATQTIAVTDATQVSISGSTMTVNPARDLSAGTAYYVNVAAGTVKDLANNAFAGISGSSTYNFSTAAPAVADDYPYDPSTTGVVTINGATASGNIETVDDADLFKVTLVQGTRYVFNMVRTTSGGLDDPYLQIYNTSGTLLASNDDGGTDYNARLFYTATSSGTFYLAAFDAADGTGRYTIQAASTANVVDDYANTTATTGRVTIGGQVTGNIEAEQDDDWFAVALTAGISYTFELRGLLGGGGTLGGNGTYPLLSLYSTTGTFIDYSDAGGAGDDPLMTFTPTTSGTYYLGVEEWYYRGTGTYTLRASSASANIAASGSVTISGTPTQGKTLTASNTLTDGDGLGTITYRWYADGTLISGTTGASLVLAEAQVGKVVTVSASYTDGHGNAESKTSSATSAVANINDAGSVRIRGIASDNQALAALVSDADGLGASFTYTWQFQHAGGSWIDIANTNFQTMKFTTFTVDDLLRVKVSYTDHHGTAETVTSNPLTFMHASVFTGTTSADTLTGSSSGADSAIYSGNFGDYTLTRTATGYTLVSKTVASNTDTLVSIDRLVFDNAVIALNPAGLAETDTMARYTAIAQKLYVAYFGRPADSNGLRSMVEQFIAAKVPNTGTADFIAAYSSNAAVKAVIDAFGNSSESAALYSGTNADFVTAIYQNVLGRAPDAAGRAFWAGAIDSGNLARGAAAMNILAGAETNTTAAGLLDAALIANRITVAANFTTAIDTAAEVAGYSGNAAAAAIRSALGLVTQTTNVFDAQVSIESLLSSLAANVASASAGAPSAPDAVTLVTPIILIGHIDHGHGMLV